eukprot:CAMPEP_0183333414 /NCGR_PEP_ID=MMETSP0164_2-20130417/2321_1 /TAXON_ID=221442 /ORGANISM="Coccolithus pelagicus ssp braarudi, Strain PLY182g" /LENGTH=86 /DNA_ID=CAMNT_0025502333 /DNA_START=36 /DNA_END=294 /DNA_ORIENTATION=-
MPSSSTLLRSSYAEAHTATTEAACVTAEPVGNGLASGVTCGTRRAVQYSSVGQTVRGVVGVGGGVGEGVSEDESKNVTRGCGRGRG